MIIKKSKKPDNSSVKPPKSVEVSKVIEEITEESSDFSVISEREERRRGDRRRGYRRSEDRNVISRAQEEANAIKELASKEGFKYGIEQARDELTFLRNSLNDFLYAKEIALQSSLNDIAFIAVKVAEKIIKTEVACDETIVLNIIKETVSAFKKDEASSLTIKTNPADVQFVQANVLNIFPYEQDEVKIRVIADEDVEWGSCIVETSNGMLDANFSTQLEILRKAFEKQI